VADSLAVIIAARNEADRIGATLTALREALPGAALWVADDASTDGTAEAAMAAGAQVVSRGRPHGKGANAGAAAEAALSVDPAPDLFLLCDGDLGASAARLAPLVSAVERGECDLAVAADTQGHVYVTGSTASTNADFDGVFMKTAGLNDIFVMKYDSAGTPLWARRLGGAGNVALNIQSLGAKPVLCSLIGNDEEGKKLLQCLDDKGIIEVDPSQKPAKDAKEASITL